ncbi:hypothetical protein ACGF7W_19680 [Streptomyces sp. NPDC048219]|uniref:hypothetical protein n=1 Tax=Streptomyces sp. NPDC048219 TaxID=3365517 RepID=UPI003722981C
MHDEEQEPRAGSVPNSFGNALAWKWTRAMPAALRRRKGFVTLLYALRAIANASGELRFQGGRPFRIQDLAAAATIREKDCRRYLEAGIRAGVIAVSGQRRRGTPTLYVLLPAPHPDWDAAEAHLKATDRPSGKDTAPWKDDEGSGTRGPSKLGPQRPEPAPDTAQDVRAPAAPPGSGREGPTGSGTRGPNTPGVIHGSLQERAGLGGQPQDVSGAEALEETPADGETPTLRPVPDAPGGPAKQTPSSGQRPLLLPVQSPNQVTREELAQLRAAATPEDIQRAVAELGRAQALFVYGHRLVAPYIAALPDDQTGT